MSSKNQQSAIGKNVGKPGDSKVVCDDIESDSEYEYEYEEIEVEVDEDYEEKIVDKTGKVMISEVETIVPSEEKKKQETHVLKSDGTTERLTHKARTSRSTANQEKHIRQEKMEKRERRTSIQERQERREKREKEEKSEKHEKQEKQEATADKPKLGRVLTSQEESILLPLLQGLLAANANDSSKANTEKATSNENQQVAQNVNSGTNSLAENNEKNREIAQGPNILDELSTALNRLQSTLLEESGVVTDTRKRNTILTLVAWLKRVLQTSTSDNADSQQFSLTELLPTELLLSKLMPELNQCVDAKSDEGKPNDRSPNSSKRFSRQRNSRFNTVGVSKEELADARLFLQEKLLSENLAITDAKQSVLLNEDDDRRKSLNLSQSNTLNKDIRAIFHERKGSFSKSVDASSPEDEHLSNMLPRAEHTTTTTTTTTKVKQTENQSKMAFRKKSTQSNDIPTDSDDDESNMVKRNTSDNSSNVTNKSMNKFALRKLKMKRANTIDVPKDQLNDTNSDQGNFENYKNSTRNEMVYQNNSIHQSVKENCNTDVDKNHLPQFQPKSPNDKKFIAFLNKNAEENHSSWVNPHKTVLPTQQKIKANNWSNKFGNIKNSFEQQENNSFGVSTSPGLSKKNHFTHAPTSPFKPVQNNKPPQIPNGIHHYQYNNNQSVLNKVAAIQSQNAPNPVPKPQLRTHQSVPTYADVPPQMYHNPSPSKSAYDWQNSKHSSFDSYMQHPVSPKIPSSSYNPLYVPLNKQINQSPSNVPYTSPFLNQMGPKPYAPPSPNDFPPYTYTSTDYTQPSCVSTFGPGQCNIPAATNISPAAITSPVVKNTSSIVKNTILPDTSYLKSTSPAKTMPPPLLGSSRLNKQMKAVDVYSSNEYLSEPNTYYQSPHPFSPTSMDSRRSSQEFMATSQIMKYPQSQTAQYINKTHQRYDDEQQAQNLRTFLSSNVRSEKRQSDYSEKSTSPFSESNFSHVNRTYVPPVETIRNKPNNSFISMENISTNKFNALEEGAPVRLKNNTTLYGSHHALSLNQFANKTAPDYDRIKSQTNQNKTDWKPVDKSQISAPMKLNSCGGQYVQPKVETNLDFSKPTFGKKSMSESSSNAQANVNRSNTITHQRVANFEIKRKQSLPAQNSDCFETGFEQQDESSTSSSFSHNYLPFGALKKSKSTHTLALLQQFEAKGKTSESVSVASPVKMPTVNVPVTESIPKPKPEIEPKSIIKKTEESKTMQQASVQSNTSILTTKKSPVQNIQNRAKTPPEQLAPPEITETPSSPLVEDGHIIFPGQTSETKRRVQHYAKTLNAMLNRKSITVDDDDDDDGDIVDTKVDSGKGGVQRSKSGTLLSVPKQYESAIKKSEVLEKERTVAAYFSGSKSPQGLQRSSSQHSMHSSTSVRTVEDQKSNTVSPMQSTDLNVDTHETSSRTTTTTTTKSAHHLKILRKQQKQTSPNPLAKSQTLPSINLLDESNVDDAFDNLFDSFVGKK